MSVDRYSGFVFSPADLAEEVDLEPDRRREILFADAKLSSWNHWQVLGIPWNAPVDAVRAAYLDKVKVFHPDRYPGKKLGSFRARLERVFRRLTEARDVLQDEARRAAYAKTTAPAEDFARLELRKLEDERRAEERRARIARQNPLFARAGRLAELVKRGKEALAAGKFAQAANDLLLAQGLDPANAEVAALAAEAKKRAAVARSAELLQRAHEAEVTGKPQGALVLYREALEADPRSARAAALGARVALAVREMGVARELAQVGVQVGPNVALAHETLGLVLEAGGDKREAKKAFERAVELDPKLETAKERLKKLRWSILR